MSELLGSNGKPLNDLPVGVNDFGNEAAIRIAKRAAHEMLQVASERIDLHMFMGIGIVLAFCYEEITGRSAKPMKPQELLVWATQSLPDIRYRRVE